MCLIRNERGADIVKDALPDSVIGAVNLAEVITKMDEFGMDAPLIAAVLDPLQLNVIPFDASLAHACGVLRRQTREFGLSLGDRACLALALKRGAVALTTDRAWAHLNQIGAIEFAR
jgi:PIN domain nuclease of toxin-antitoxin system